MPYERVAARASRTSWAAAPRSCSPSSSRAPMAAASLGQVHRARLHDGATVVVKVQYPGIAEALRSDLDNLGLVVKTWPAPTGRSTGGVLHELARGAGPRARLLAARRAPGAEFAQGLGGLSRTRRPRDHRGAHRTRGADAAAAAWATLKYFLACNPTTPSGCASRGLLIRAIYGSVPARRHRPRRPAPGELPGDAGRQAGRARLRRREALLREFFEASPRRVPAGARSRSHRRARAVRRVGFTVELPDDEARALLEELHPPRRPRAAHRRLRLRTRHHGARQP